MARSTAQIWRANGRPWTPVFETESVEGLVVARDRCGAHDASVHNWTAFQTSVTQTSLDCATVEFSLVEGVVHEQH